MIWLILEARAEICQKKVHFLEDLKTPKFHSEINWPLTQWLWNKISNLSWIEMCKILANALFFMVFQRNVFEIAMTTTWFIKWTMKNICIKTAVTGCNIKFPVKHTYHIEATVYMRLYSKFHKTLSPKEMDKCFLILEAYADK